MKLSKNFSNLSRSLFVRWKATVQRLKGNPKEKRVLFIVGCQRSGTTLLSRIFERDLQTKTFGEAGAVTRQGSTSRLRLKPLSDVQQEIERAHAPLIVIKPFTYIAN